MRCFDASRIASRQAVSFVAVFVVISRLAVHEWITIGVLLAAPAWNLVLRHVLLGDVCNSDSDGNQVSSMLGIWLCACTKAYRAGCTVWRSSLI
jgi:hypothetical protein